MVSCVLFPCFGVTCFVVRCLLFGVRCALIDACRSVLYVRGLSIVGRCVLLCVVVCCFTVVDYC